VIKTLFCPHHRRAPACLEPPWNTGPSRRRSVRCGRPNAGRRGPVCRVADCAPCRFAGLGSNFYSRVCLVRFCIFFLFSTPGCVWARCSGASAAAGGLSAPGCVWARSEKRNFAVMAEMAGMRTAIPGASHGYLAPRQRASSGGTETIVDLAYE
jgi:hypothetical protein